MCVSGRRSYLECEVVGGAKQGVKHDRVGPARPAGVALAVLVLVLIKVLLVRSLVPVIAGVLVIA